MGASGYVGASGGGWGWGHQDNWGQQEGAGGWGWQGVLKSAENGKQLCLKVVFEESKHGAAECVYGASLPWLDELKYKHLAVAVQLAVAMQLMGAMQLVGGMQLICEAGIHQVPGGNCRLDGGYQGQWHRAAASAESHGMGVCKVSRDAPHPGKPHSSDLPCAARIQQDLLTFSGQTVKPICVNPLVKLRSDLLGLPPSGQPWSNGQTPVAEPPC